MYFVYLVANKSINNVQGVWKKSPGLNKLVWGLFLCVLMGERVMEMLDVVELIYPR